MILKEEKTDKNNLEGDELKFFEPEIEEIDIPEQKEFYELPVRFGAIPLDEAPFGWEVETRRKQTKITKFEHAFPKIRLPFQEVLREDFGHSDEFEKNPLFPTGSNRLFFGDNLYVMRQLPSKSIDLIYIAPPFFSGRNYNVLFGDTPVLPDEPEVEPLTLPDSTKPASRSVLVDHPDLEIVKPSRMSVLGFLAPWLVVGFLIGAFFWILH